MMNRREALAALASTAAVPLLHGCGNGPTPPSTMKTNTDADALALLDQIGENYLRFAPESATSLGIDTGARAALRSQLADRSADGQQKIAEPGPAGSRTRQGVRHRRASRTPPAPASRSCAARMPPRSKGFALPYGDITVGSWRNTPYVVIQNVGAYLDLPRFLDSDHPIENAADAEAYLARLQSYAKQLDGELGRIQAARGKGLVPPAFLIDKALSQMRLSAKNAREGGSLVESIARRTKIDSRQLGRARARRLRRRKSRRRSIARSPSSRRSAQSPRTMPACGRGRTATSSIAGRSRRRPPPT